jgi:hypothetical protein
MNSPRSNQSEANHQSKSESKQPHPTSTPEREHEHRSVSESVARRYFHILQQQLNSSLISTHEPVRLGLVIIFQFIRHSGRAGVTSTSTSRAIGGMCVDGRLTRSVGLVACRLGYYLIGNPTRNWTWIPGGVDRKEHLLRWIRYIRDLDNGSERTYCQWES